MAFDGSEGQRKRAVRKGVAERGRFSNLQPAGDVDTAARLDRAEKIQGHLLADGRNESAAEDGLDLRGQDDGTRALEGSSSSSSDLGGRLGIHDRGRPEGCHADEEEQLPHAAGSENGAVERQFDGGATAKGDVGQEGGVGARDRGRGCIEWR